MKRSVESHNVWTSEVYVMRSESKPWTYSETKNTINLIVLKHMRMRMRMDRVEEVYNVHKVVINKSEAIMRYGWNLISPKTGNQRADSIRAKIHFV